jgi:hypothetical protein
LISNKNKQFINSEEANENEYQIILTQDITKLSGENVVNIHSSDWSNYNFTFPSNSVNKNWYVVLVDSDGKTIIDYTNIITVKDGNDGKSAIHLELTQDYISLPCLNGKVHPSYNDTIYPISSRMTLYDGDEEITSGIEYSFKIDGKNTTAISSTDGKFTIHRDLINGDTNIECIATYNNISFHKILLIELTENPYELELSTNVLVRGDNNHIVTNSLSAKVKFWDVKQGTWVYTAEGVLTISGATVKENIKINPISEGDITRTVNLSDSDIEENTTDEEFRISYYADETLKEELTYETLGVIKNGKNGNTPFCEKVEICGYSKNANLDPEKDEGWVETIDELDLKPGDTFYIRYKHHWNDGNNNPYYRYSKSVSIAGSQGKDGSGYNVMLSNPVAVIPVGDDNWKTDENFNNQSDSTLVYLYDNTKDLSKDIKIYIKPEYTHFKPDVDGSGMNMVTFTPVVDGEAFDFGSNAQYKLPITVTYELGKDVDSDGDDDVFTTTIYWTLTPIKGLQDIEVFVDKRVVNTTVKKEHSFKVGYYLISSNNSRTFVGEKNGKYDIMITDNIDTLTEDKIVNNWTTCNYTFTDYIKCFVVLVEKNNEGKYNIIDSIDITPINDGKDGIIKFKSTVFTRSSTQPAPPTGGEWDDPEPDLVDGKKIWEDGIPEGNDPIYSSYRWFSNKVGFESNWSDAVLMADTPDFEVIYSSEDNITNYDPNDFEPSFFRDDTGGISRWLSRTGLNGIWSDDGDSTSIWMATINKANNKWGNWSVTKIKGEKGDAGSAPSCTGVEILGYSDVKLEISDPITESGYADDNKQQKCWAKSLNTLQSGLTAGQIIYILNKYTWSDGTTTRGINTTLAGTQGVKGDSRVLFYLGSFKDGTLTGESIQGKLNSTRCDYYIDSSDRAWMRIGDNVAEATGHANGPDKDPNSENKKYWQASDKVGFLQANAISANMINVKSLVTSDAFIGNLQVGKANITEKLTANEIDVNTLTVNAAQITGTLDAKEVTIANLTVDAAQITGTLSWDNISSEPYKLISNVPYLRIRDFHTDGDKEGYRIDFNNKLNDPLLSEIADGNMCTITIKKYNTTTGLYSDDFIGNTVVGHRVITYTDDRGPYVEKITFTNGIYQQFDSQTYLYLNVKNIRFYLYEDNITRCMVDIPIIGSKEEYNPSGGLTTSNVNDLITTQISKHKVATDQIEANAITANQIAANAITTEKIAVGAITANQIAANAITADKIATGVIPEGLDKDDVTQIIGETEIDGGKIRTDSITATQIKGGTITADKIATGVIPEGLDKDDVTQIIGETEIDGGKIRTDSITAAQIKGGTITANEIDVENLTASILTADRIKTFELDASQIKTGEISAELINVDELSVEKLNTNPNSEEKSTISIADNMISIINQSKQLICSFSDNNIKLKADSVFNKTSNYSKNISGWYKKDFVLFTLYQSNDGMDINYEHTDKRHSIGTFTSPGQSISFTVNATISINFARFLQDTKSSVSFSLSPTILITTPSGKTEIIKTSSATSNNSSSSNTYTTVNYYSAEKEIVKSFNKIFNYIANEIGEYKFTIGFIGKCYAYNTTASGQVFSTISSDTNVEVLYGEENTSCATIIYGNGILIKNTIGDNTCGILFNDECLLLKFGKNGIKIDANGIKYGTTLDTDMSELSWKSLIK